MLPKVPVPVPTQYRKLASRPKEYRNRDSDLASTFENTSPLTVEVTVRSISALTSGAEYLSVGLTGKLRSLP